MDRARAEQALEATQNQGVELALEWLYSEAGAAGGDVEMRDPAEEGAGPAAEAEAVVLPQRVPGLAGVESVHSGPNHMVACTAGSTWTWGSNHAGQLGQGHTAAVGAPARLGELEGVRVVGVACGTGHTVFLSAEGAVYGCGAQEQGQLGAGQSAEAVLAPVKLSEGWRLGRPITHVSAGGHSTLLLSAEPVQPGPRYSWEDAALAFPRVIDSGDTAALGSLIKDVFGSAEAIAFVFCARDAAGRVRLDVGRLEQTYNQVLRLASQAGRNTRVNLVKTQLEATLELANALYARRKLLAMPERVNVLAAVCQTPLLSDRGMGEQLVPLIARALLGVPEAGARLLTELWSECPHHLLAVRLVRPLQGFITHRLQASPRLEVAVVQAIEWMALLEEASQLGGGLLPPEEFYNELISSKFDAASQYMTWRENRQRSAAAWTGPGHDQKFSFLHFPFLLNSRAKSQILQVESSVTMNETIHIGRLEQYAGISAGQKLGGVLRSPQTLNAPVAPQRRKRPTAPGPARPRQRQRLAAGRGEDQGEEGGAARGFFASLQGIFQPAASPASPDGPGLQRAGSLLPAPADSDVPATSPQFCMFRLRRTHLVADALDEVARQRQRDLFKPLRVHFLGEDGVDGGGVQKEFFQLFFEEVFTATYGMFKQFAETQTLWFDSGSLELDEEFYLVGVLVGMAVYNRVLLDAGFPRLLYAKLLGQPVGLRDLAGFQPDVARSLEKLLSWEGPGAVEDVFALDFTINTQRFDRTETVELKPGGREVAVTAKNREEYVELYVDFLLNRAVARQYEAFARGFLTLVGGQALELFRPQELENLVCGTQVLDFKALEANARYEGGYGPGTPVCRWFWYIVNEEFGPEEKKQLLKFFTGSDRAPIGGLRHLKCKIQRAGPDSMQLPTAHTCFNTLLLPEYGSRGKTRDRVLTAITNCTTFGLE